jgi:hemerythrin-like metal-binding protein
VVALQDLALSQYQLPVVDTETMPRVALASMNQVHLEEVDLINRLGEMMDAISKGVLDAEQINQILIEWVEHTRCHFDGENRLMKIHAFPPYSVHAAEHAKVMTRIESVRDQWLNEGDLDSLADFIFVEWRTWFDQHVKSMDSVTAEFLNQRV